jgi:sugar phosphate isomerase/epimerase
VIILHLPPLVAAEGGGGDDGLTLVRRSLDTLMPFARDHGVRIALENMSVNNFHIIELLLSEYGPDFLGLCYDAGHGNVEGHGLDYLERVKGRLISVHLHDNDGTGDQHNLLFAGTVDWNRLAGILATSSYEKCVSMELSIRNSGFTDEVAFLQRGFETGTRFAAMIAAAKGAQGAWQR